MNVREFSDSFDTLLNSYSTIPGFGDTQGMDIKFDEYEKSVFLTEAQESLVIELYSGRNTFGSSLEGTEELRRYLSGLVNTTILTEQSEGHVGLSNYSVFYDIPEEVWFITYESVNLSDDTLGCLNGTTTLVTPVTQDEYYNIARNPFRGVSGNRVLRLDAGDKLVELVSKYNISSYTIRYLSQPSPIILIDLPDGLLINGTSVKTECVLNPALHRTILERAIRLALMSKGYQGKPSNE